jgi:hypothetical protein
MGKLIPFRWLPASWGLSGKAYDEAQAYYSLEGYELEMRLAEINSADTASLMRTQADINKNHGVIDEYDWMRQHILAETLDKPIDREVELTKLDIEFGRVEKRTGEKKIAELLGEPWVGIVEEGLDPAQGPNGFFFVFDWNDKWIEQLRAHGYEGATDDDLMEKWFADVCRNEVMQSAPIPFNSSVVYD